MTPTKVHQLVRCCRNPKCGRPMWLVHNPETGRASAWYCEPCNDWADPEEKQRLISKADWDHYIKSDRQLAGIKHGDLQPGLADINRG